MKEDFDFKQIGKQMPYKVPSGFFDEISEKILDENERRSHHPTKVIHFKRWIGVAAVVATIAGGVWFVFEKNNAGLAPIAQQIRKPDTVQQTQSIIDKHKSVQQGQQIVSAPNKKQEALPTRNTEPVSAASNTKQVESLDETLNKISDEELAQLVAYADNDVIIDE